jgi:Ion transport protein
MDNSASNSMAEDLQSPLERKHSNDPNKLVSTKLLQKLMGDGGDSCYEQDVQDDDDDEEEVFIVVEEEDDDDDDSHHETLTHVTTFKTSLKDRPNNKMENNTKQQAPFKENAAADGDVKSSKKSAAASETDVDNNKNQNSPQFKRNLSSSASSMANDSWNPNKSDKKKPNNENNDNSSNNNNISASYDQRSWFRECIDAVNQFRYHCGMVVNNSYVQLLIILLIGVNAIMLGLATFDFIKLDPHLNQAFETTDFVFLIIFTIELGMQFIYHGFRLLLDGWLVFDLIIVVSSWSFASVQIVRAFRIFRALRLITRIKILKHLILGKPG